MAFNIGIVVFEDAEELDFVGPWEVFTMAVRDRVPDASVVLIAEKTEPVRCAKGLRVVPDCTFADAPKLDVVLIPGGQGTRTEMHNAAFTDWLRRVAPECTWITSVCTGSLILSAAGLLEAKQATTHWAALDLLRDVAPQTTVLENARYVQDGNIVTAAGVSAGIDMALWLVGQIWGVDHAQLTQRLIEYYPDPPYAEATAG